jgi:hypothetical protein
MTDLSATVLGRGFFLPFFAAVIVAAPVSDPVTAWSQVALRVTMPDFFFFAVFFSATRRGSVTLPETPNPRHGKTTHGAQGIPGAATARRGTGEDCMIEVVVCP